MEGAGGAARLNPYAPVKKELERKRREKGSAEQKEMEAKVKARKAASREYNKKQKRGPDTFYKTLMKAKRRGVSLCVR